MLSCFEIFRASEGRSLPLFPSFFSSPRNPSLDSPTKKFPVATMVSLIREAGDGRG